MKVKIDLTALYAALRTAGALMIGNVFVAAILLGNRDWLSLGALLFLGVAVIVSASLIKEK